MRAHLADRVKVARRFTRAVRVDTDFSDARALDGYVCSPSAVEAILQMVRHHEATGHGAFTWTGPYGSGKSSLALALSALAAGSDDDVSHLLQSVRASDRSELVRGFRPTDQRWSVVPVVGRRENPETVIAEALASQVKSRKGLGRRRDEALHSWAARIAADPSHAGLVLIIDEMGKFLEGAARDIGDVYLFQELAETASRSDSRLLVVGILHQAFDEYAHRLAREARDEWLKIQGRYLDIPINLAGDEQLDLIGRAIDGRKPAIQPVFRAIASAIQGARSGDVASLEDRLASCWPMHPVVAALLGPISRRRFGQNQRSLFGFLNSAEPSGFQAFLQESPDEDGALFPVSRLWDYLRANLEPAILASPDGHRWSTALEAVLRAEAKGASADHLALLKAVALIDLFKDQSGLQATPAVLQTILPDISVQGLLDELKHWSVIIYRSHIGAYAIYAGSDFDIEAAIDEARRNGVAMDYRRLAQRAGLKPILAKRHYEDTGALRWFEVELAPLHEVEDRIRTYKPSPGAAGLFLLVVSANAETESEAKRMLGQAVMRAEDRLVVCGWAQDSYMIREMAADLAALEHVRGSRAELEGDAVARREVDARIARISADLEDRLSAAIDRVRWILPPDARSNVDAQVKGPAGLSVLASRLAEWRYALAPRIRNELLNRTRPSSNAQAAVRALLKAMVLRASEPRLGIEGYPPELGLYISVLEATALHRPSEGRDGYAFVAPSGEDPSRLWGLWQVADAVVAANSGGVTAADVYKVWRDPPFGLRDGLSPVVLIAYLLSCANRSAVYLDGVFRPRLDSLLVDRLLQDPAKVSMRAVEISEIDFEFVAEMAHSLSSSSDSVVPTPLDVARALVAEIRSLPNWTQRTSHLSAPAATLRDRAKIADDPNRLLLEDIPAAVRGIQGGSDTPLAAQAAGLLSELRDAYPQMLARLEALLLHELRVRGRSDADFAALRQRAETVRNLIGDNRFDALAIRLVRYHGTREDIEGVISLATNKPPRDWVDRDVDNVSVELAAMAQKFLKAELFVRLKGRTGGRIAVGVYISDPRFPDPQTREVELDALDQEAAKALSLRLGALLEAEGVSREVSLAALANLGLTLSEVGTTIPEVTE